MKAGVWRVAVGFVGGERSVSGLVVADAARIGLISTIVALCVSLAALGIIQQVTALAAFGITFEPWPSPLLGGLFLVGGSVLTVIAAAIAAASLVRTDPRMLLSS